MGTTLAPACQPGFSAGHRQHCKCPPSREGAPCSGVGAYERPWKGRALHGHHWWPPAGLRKPPVPLGTSLGIANPVWSPSPPQRPLCTPTGSWPLASSHPCPLDSKENQDERNLVPPRCQLPCLTAGQCAGGAALSTLPCGRTSGHTIRVPASAFPGGPRLHVAVLTITAVALHCRASRTFPVPTREFLFPGSENCVTDSVFSCVFSGKRYISDSLTALSTPVYLSHLY